MIRIARDRRDENGAWIRPDDAWIALAKTSRENAVEDGAAHAASGAVYAHLQVRMALEKLFYDKCAYCEGKAMGQADWDVEHFRPKGRVAERKDHPGYYWLAYDWENLYPSCAHCNQKRKDRPRWGDLSAANEPALGKLDQFPLSTETSRAMAPTDDHLAEAALLLDPCRDDPEAHIRFDVRGAVSPVAKSRRGKSSIDVFHLKRKRLRDQRRERIGAVVQLLLAVIRPLEARLGPADPAVTELRAFLDGTYLADSAPFAGAARWVLRDPASFGL